LSRTGQLAEGVAHKNRAGYLFPEQIARMWQDRGHPRAHIASTDDGRMPDLNASNIGDRIMWSSRQDTDL
jgi:hypothetical protein